MPSRQPPHRVPGYTKKRVSVTEPEGRGRVSPDYVRTLRSIGANDLADLVEKSGQVDQNDDDKA